MKTYEELLLFIIKNIRYTEYTVLFLKPEKALKLLKEDVVKVNKKKELTMNSLKKTAWLSEKETVKTVSYTLGTSK